VQDDFWPERDVLGHHFTEEVDSIVGVLLVQGVAMLVFQLGLEVADHTQQ
jgi:hypothetical protein